MEPVLARFLVFEFGIYALALFCFVHAWRQGPQRAFAIITAAIFTFAAESLVIRVTGEYYYNSFLVTLCLGGTAPGFGVVVSCSDHSTCVPLAVPLMESLIIYAAMLTSDRLLLPMPVRSLFDGLLALSIDFGLDPIVSRSVFCGTQLPPANVPDVGLGFWVWQLNSDVEYLIGIDLNNYAGWFLGIAMFSFTQRLLRRWVQPGSRGVWGDLGMAIISLPLSMLLFAPVVFAYRFAVESRLVPEWVLFSVLIAVSLFLSGYYGRSAKHDNEFDVVPLAVPLFLYLYVLFALFLNGMYIERPELVGIWAVAFTVCMLGFTWPSWSRTRRRSEPGPAA